MKKLLPEMSPSVFLTWNPVEFCMGDPLCNVQTAPPWSLLSMLTKSWENLEMIQSRTSCSFSTYFLECLGRGASRCQSPGDG